MPLMALLRIVAVLALLLAGLLWAATGVGGALGGPVLGLSSAAFAAPYNTLLLVDVTRGRQHEVSRSSSSEHIVGVWDAAGRTLMFERTLGSRALYQFSTPGRVEPAMGLVSVARGALPAWSPGGTTWVAWGWAGGGRGIWLHTPHTTPVLLAGPVARADGDGLAFTPDGTRVLFSAQGVSIGRDVYTVDVATRAVTNLTQASSDDRGAVPAPDGAHIAFHSTRDGNTEIYVMNADGSAPRNISRHPGLDFGPVWSPDGALLAFTTSRNGRYAIVLADVRDPAAPPRLLTSAEADDFSPSWSPDGVWIAFVSHRLGLAATFIVPADGTDAPRRVLARRGTERPVAWWPR